MVNAPPGLEYLALVDQLIIRQEVQMLAVFTGWETNNRYTVTNSANQTVYYAVEVNNFLTINYFGSSRPFDMIILDNYRREVLRINRPFRPEGFGFAGIVQVIEVRSAVGQLLGQVIEIWRMCGAQFRVNNASGQTVLWIEGPACQCPFMDTDFKVLSTDGTMVVGTITRHFPGFLQEMYTKADVFGVRFPMDLDVAIKAVLLAATFLIDFMHFEVNRHRERNSNY